MSPTFQSPVVNWTYKIKLIGNNLTVCIIILDTITINEYNFSWNAELMSATNVIKFHIKVVMSFQKIFSLFTFNQLIRLINLVQHYYSVGAEFVFAVDMWSYAHSSD